MTIIAALDENNAIGNNNQLLWHLPLDLKRFKSLTQNHVILMGRKTFESLGRPLPNRQNMVISSKADYPVTNNVYLFSSLHEAIEAARSKDSNPYIIGGGTIYSQALKYADTLELTLVHTQMDKADTYFPEIDFSEWNKTFDEFHPKDDKHLYDFRFVTYQRKK
ncbi:dihydrofolate reductase [Apibacter mensalis]|uniref:dihydrofolate reductase n=1 Tax=Apibacter mensalis TaxID=1586267 RepID=UPI0026ED9E05|nr:dihydrofolate reductase [Apibacter mensalis]